jgi:isopenicillin-N N-acyltransferase-like protein
MTSRRNFLAGAALLGAGRSGRHYCYDFRGTAYEVGVQHGRALKAEIRREAQPAVDALGATAPARAVAHWEGLFAEHMPAVLEEIHGIAEGAELPYPYAFFAATRDQMPREGCTAFVARGFIGQTKDTSAPLDRFRVMRIAYAGGRGMVVLNYPGWVGNLAITSDRVCFTGNSLWADAPARKTTPGSFLKRLIMEKPSVAAVLDTIRGMAFENGCYTLADAGGRAVCLECVAGRVGISDVSGRDFGHANTVLMPELKRFERTSEVCASSAVRQRSIDRLLAAARGRITAGSLEGMMRDHEGYPLSICRHPSPADPDTTNAAFVADLAGGKMHIAIGNPCAAPFRTYAVPA